jgi:HEAT repeat protein
MATLISSWPSGVCAQISSTPISLSDSAPHQQLIADLASTNVTTRLEAAKEMDAQRRQTINHLMALLDSTNSDEVKRFAMVVAGKYRAEEAVQFLVNHLDWEVNMPAHDDSIHAPPTKLNDEQFQADNTPVSGALREIGMPAVPWLLEKIRTSDDSKVTRKCVLICWNIEGEEVIQFRLQRLLYQETNQIAKARIQSALDFLKDVTPSANRSGRSVDK